MMRTCLLALAVVAVMGTETPSPTKTPSLTDTPDFEVPQSIDIEARTVVIQYEHPVREATTIYTEEFLTIIRDFEQRFVDVEGFEKYCFKPAGTADCRIPISVANAAFNGGIIQPMDFIRAVLENPAWRPNVGKNYPEIQRSARTYVHFGGPLFNFTNIEHQADVQDYEFDFWWRFTMKPHLEEVMEEFKDKITITFRGGPFGIYKQWWDFYIKKFNPEFLSQNGQRILVQYGLPHEQAARYRLFAENVKKIEYISTLRPGSVVPELFNEYMHMTHPEFLRTVYSMPKGKQKPHASTWLMWNIQPDLTEFRYPP